MKKGVRERGISFADFLIWCVFLGVILSLVLKIVPHYIDHHIAVDLIEDLKMDPRSKTLDDVDLKSILAKKFKVNDLNHFMKNDRVKIMGSGRAREVRLSYEVRDALVVNMDFVLHFDDRFSIGN